MTTKRDLHRLVDELPDGEITAAGRYLEYLRNMGDPILRMLDQASMDDESPSDEDRAAVAEGREQYRRGEGTYLEHQPRTA